MVGIDDGEKAKLGLSVKYKTLEAALEPGSVMQALDNMMKEIDHDPLIGGNVPKILKVRL